MPEDFEMHETLNAAPTFRVRDEEYRRLLGYPRNHVLCERAVELSNWARDWYERNGRPWTYTRRVNVRVSEESVELDGLLIQSVQLREHLSRYGAESAMLLAASAGRECEEHARQLWESGRPDEYFFLEVFGSAVVEELVATTNGRICDGAADTGLMAVPHYSPGYMGWDVVDQQKIFDLITRNLTDPLPGPIEVMSSGMLRPKKSMLAVFGLAPEPQVPAAAPKAATPCSRCSFSPCQYRRERYRHDPSGARRAEPTLAKTNRGYTLNSRALRKWAGERVSVSNRSDGTLEAVFRFDGTTCSNMGRPLAFDYRVIVSPGDDLRILETSCGPTPGDTGYQSTCAYLDNPGKHLADITSDRPLIGRPLGEVLTWQRASAPSGCHCSADARLHKWGLALEVIHYALNEGRVPQAVS